MERSPIGEASRPTYPREVSRNSGMESFIAEKRKPSMIPRIIGLVMIRTRVFRRSLPVSFCPFPADRIRTAATLYSGTQPSIIRAPVEEVP